MNITTLGAHNCESQHTRLSSILVDDRLMIDAGAITASLSFADQEKLAAVLLTHQHYDHIKDIPLLAFNRAMQWSAIDVYSTAVVYEALKLLFENQLYPNFLEFPDANPALKFNTVEPYRTVEVAGYRVQPLPVNHSSLTCGFHVADVAGRNFFYTGDTGVGLENCWQHISPELLITEVSAPDRFRELYERRGHFTPGLLRQEMENFRQLKGYLPQIVIVHMNPGLEDEIRRELETVARALDHPITPASEGMRLKV